MPTYEYACKECGEHLEVVQSFKDQALTECPACGGPLRKVFGSIGIAFKGSGFYKTDSRSTAKSDSGKSASGKSEAGKGESGQTATGSSSEKKTASESSSASPAEKSSSTSESKSKAAAS